MEKLNKETVLSLTNLVEATKQVKKELKQTLKNTKDLLSVVLTSILDNCSKDYQYVIKVLYTDISETNKKKISKFNRIFIGK